jgi:hypothetical protein
LVSLSILLVLATIAACSTSLPGRNPTGEVFPTVVGQSLEKEQVNLPSVVAGEPAVLLIGFEQDAQFDIDRWLMGLIQSGANARILELPTIPGLIPNILSERIDDGMRSGIPREDWSVVVTLYGSSAQPVAALTGTEEGQLARVIVLDADGRVAWFDDTGYSARKALDVAGLVNELKGS